MQVIENISITKARNKRAMEIFTRNGFNIRLHGSEKSPMFILDDQCILSCFVNGNNLYFRPSPDSGDISQSYSLTDNSFITKYEISEFIEQSEHLPIYCIRLAGSKMCLVGFNYLNKEEDVKDDQFPVFALYNPIIFVNLDKAIGISHKLKGQGYNVEVV
jgi:hypothetical protein